MSEEHVRPDLDMLADYLEDLLSEEERAEVERAVAEDPSTAALLAELEGLPALLSADPPEPMPADRRRRRGARRAGGDQWDGQWCRPGRGVGYGCRGRSGRGRGQRRRGST
jgi:anti-sigma factor RsiW